MRFVVIYLLLAITPAFCEDTVNIKAEQFDYDKKKDVVYAFKNVHVIYKKNNNIDELFSDELIYDRKTKKILAKGNVKIKDHEGNLDYSEAIELTEDFKQGTIDSIHIVTPKSERVLANKCVKIGQKSYFTNGSYTPCKTCGKDDDPAWQFFAKEIIHNEEDHSITYKNAILYIYKVPIFYTPYFFHHDPSIKRKSGLLFPYFGYHTNEGFMITPSYYQVIDEYSDITFTPTLMEKDTPIYSAYYRKKFFNGAIDINGTFHKNKDYIKPQPLAHPVNNALPIPQNRWSVYSKIGYDIDSTQKINAKISRASDTAYFMKYPSLLTKQAMDYGDLVSFAFYERFQPNYYLGIKTSDYQTELPKTTPLVAPNVILEIFSEKTLFGGNWIFTTQFDHLRREWGVPGIFGKESTRLYSNFSWERCFIQKNHVFKTSLEMNGVFYYIYGFQTATRLWNVKDPALYQNQTNKRFSANRFIPVGALEWSYPLIQRSSFYNWIVEPKIKLIASPFSSNDNLPNNDSRTLTLDNTSLFMNDRFDGHDRFDSGVRLVYGFNQKIYLKGSNSIEWFIGHTKRLDNRQIFMNAAYGEDTKYSDIVNAVKFVPIEWLKLRYRNAIDYKTSYLRFQEVGGQIGTPIFKVDLGYIRVPNTDFNTQMVNQLSWNISSKINDAWSMSYSEIRDMRIQNNMPLTKYATVNWQNDCLKVSVGGFISNLQNQDVQPVKGFLVELDFKLLGTYTPLQADKYMGTMLSHF
jgi:LPS-assembly protein